MGFLRFIIHARIKHRVYASTQPGFAGYPGNPGTWLEPGPFPIKPKPNWERVSQTQTRLGFKWPQTQTQLGFKRVQTQTRPGFTITGSNPNPAGPWDYWGELVHKNNPNISTTYTQKKFRAYLFKTPLSASM